MVESLFLGGGGRVVSHKCKPRPKDALPQPAIPEGSGGARSSWGCFQGNFSQPRAGLPIFDNPGKVFHPCSRHGPPMAGAGRAAEHFRHQGTCLARKIGNNVQSEVSHARALPATQNLIMFDKLFPTRSSQKRRCFQVPGLVMAGGGTSCQRTMHLVILVFCMLGDSGVSGIRAKTKSGLYGCLLAFDVFWFPWIFVFTDFTKINITSAHGKIRVFLFTGAAGDHGPHYLPAHDFNSNFPEYCNLQD